MGKNFHESIPIESAQLSHLFPLSIQFSHFKMFYDSCQRGTNFVNGTNSIGISLENSANGINQCQQICSWILDCEAISWKDGNCKLIKGGEQSSNSENIHEVVKVSYDIGSLYGAWTCNENCVCALRACNYDRTFSMDRYNGTVIFNIIFKNGTRTDMSSQGQKMTKINQKSNISLRN